MIEYIKRDEALSFPFANGKYDHKNANEHFIFGCESYREWLENLPIADVRENVHAKWILVDDGTDYWAFWECSNCHNECYAEGKMRMKYCPACGAQMDGGEEP